MINNAGDLRGPKLIVYSFNWLRWKRRPLRPLRR